MSFEVSPGVLSMLSTVELAGSVMFGAVAAQAMACSLVDRARPVKRPVLFSQGWRFAPAAKETVVDKDTGERKGKWEKVANLTKATWADLVASVAILGLAVQEGRPGGGRCRLDFEVPAGVGPEFYLVLADPRLAHKVVLDRLKAERGGGP